MHFNWHKWYKHSVVFVLLLCGFAGFAQSNPEHWDAKYYTGYSVQTFKQLPAVQQKISATKFNHRLLDAALFFRTNEERIKNNLPEFYFSIALEKAGCFAIVLEKIPADLATKVAKMLTIPIIGIGAGNGVDGQVLVIHDMLGINNEFSPRFLRKYNNLYEQMMVSFQNYISDVQSGDFPNKNEQY